jgi:transcriptional regulator with XRE-family HTH domain
MSSLYDNIHSLCEKEGIKDGTLCSNIGIRRSFLSELKAGRSKSLSTDTLSKIAAYFDVSVDYLLTGEQKEKAPLPQNGREADIQALLDILRNQNDEDYAFSMAAIGKILK